ncbi:MAG: VCBS repeat-containing protein [Planctomycetota bacterium]|nr:VCBS repeat-containing protein [Planctomycetota bacterium]
MADLDGDGTPEVLLVDKRAKKLLVLSRGPQGAYRQVDEHDIGDFQFRGIEVADADGDGNPDAVLYGQDRFGILYGGAKDPEWDEAGFYESDARDAHLVLVTAGSFFGGATHAVVVDARNNTVEILSLAPKAGGEGIAIRRSARFKVFEAKSFRGRREAPTENEPREAAIADVTGDGKTDLILLCHDRLLVYPRE